MKFRCRKWPISSHIYYSKTFCTTNRKLLLFTWNALLGYFLVLFDIFILFKMADRQPCWLPNLTISHHISPKLNVKSRTSCRKIWDVTCVFRKRNAIFPVLCADGSQIKTFCDHAAIFNITGGGVIMLQNDSFCFVTRKL